MTTKKTTATKKTTTKAAAKSKQISIVTHPLASSFSFKIDVNQLLDSGWEMIGEIRVITPTNPNEKTQLVAFFEK